MSEGKDGLDFLLDDWVQLPDWGWKVVSVFSKLWAFPLWKRNGGLCRMRKNKTAVLRPRVQADKLEKNGHVRMGICWRNIQTLWGSEAKERFHHGLQSKTQTIKDFGNITLKNWMKDNEHKRGGKFSPSWANLAFVQRNTGSTGEWTLFLKPFRFQELLNVGTFILSQSPHCIHPIQILRHIGHPLCCATESHSTVSFYHHVSVCQSHSLTWETMINSEKCNFKTRPTFPHC